MKPFEVDTVKISEHFGTPLSKVVFIQHAINIYGIKDVEKILSFMTVHGYEIDADALLVLGYLMGLCRASLHYEPIIENFFIPSLN